MTQPVTETAHRHEHHHQAPDPFENVKVKREQILPNQDVSLPWIDPLDGPTVIGRRTAINKFSKFIIHQQSAVFTRMARLTSQQCRTIVQKRSLNTKEKISNIEYGSCIGTGERQLIIC
jgi:hypothetical protein